MDKLRAIAGTAFQEVLRKRVSYIGILVALLIVIILFSQMGFLRMATEAGETEITSEIKRSAVTNIVGIWFTTAYYLAIFLGSAALSSEIRARTIVAVLARPIDRWVYLTGRWLGILCYIFCFIAVGFAIAFAVIWQSGLQFAPIFWIGVAQIFVTTFFISGVSLGLSTSMPAVAAGACTLLLTFLPQIVNQLLNHPNPVVRFLAALGYFLSPAQMPVSPIESSFTRELASPDYWLYTKVLIENTLYAVLVFILGCIRFTRSELRLR